MIYTSEDIKKNPGMARLVKKAEEKERRASMSVPEATDNFFAKSYLNRITGKGKVLGEDPLPAIVERQAKALAKRIDDNFFFIFDITPIGKPRMTRRDKYAKIRTAAASKYFTWRNRFEELVREQGFEIGDGVQVVFLMPMHPTWSKAKKDAMRGTPHQVKPDADNMLKGFIDVLSKADQTIYDKHPLKFWWDTGKIVVLRNEPLYKSVFEIPGFPLK